VATLAELNARLEAIDARYRGRFAGHPRISRDPEELESLIREVEAAVKEAGKSADAAFTDRSTASLDLYRNELAQIQEARAAGPAAVQAHRLVSVAQMIMGRYTRFFAGQSRTTRNVGLLEEFIRDLTTITTELEGLKARGADVTADLERIQQTLSVYRQETGAIRSARGDDSLPSQAQRLAGLANDQFERYRQLFANQSRVSRHPQTLESMIHTLKEVHAQMLALRTRGVSGGSHAKNISIVGERIESWETELRTIRDVVARAPVTERVGRLGEAANAIFAAYREEFAGKDRRSRDKARLGVIIEQLWPIFRSMDAIDRLDGDDTNARNLSIVTDQLRIYDREYTAIAQAQAPAKA
jgi:hypothetical protein